jgi:AmiR/NasT family two-component response regulator
MKTTRLIVVEDDALIRRALCETLLELGYLVVGEARDGVSAVNLTRALHPDLVMMDIQLPQLGGLEAAAILWQERLAPVLVLTGHTDHALITRARAVGIAGYLVKPYRPEALRPAIELALAQFAEYSARDTQLHELKRDLETHKLVERAKGVLMTRQKLSDQEATRRIQQLATTTHRPIKSVAEALLLAEELRQ